ncbi:MAG: type II secretion system protein GspN [Pseudomonadota bacterium]
MKILLGLGVVAYVLAAALLAAHYTFPYQAAGQALRDRIPALGPLHFEFEGPEPGKPLTYFLGNLSLDLDVPSGRTRLIAADQVRLNLHPLALLGRKAAVDFRVQAAGGESLGRAVYHLTGKHELTLEIEQIDLPTFELALPGGQGRISGKLTGRAIILGENDTLPVGGEGVLRMEKGRIAEIKVPDLPLDEFEFDLLTLGFKLEPNQIIVEKLEIEGPQGGVSLSGRIVDLRKPRLNFTGQARLGPVDSPLFSANFQTTGPLAQPRVRVTSTKGPSLK